MSDVQEPELKIDLPEGEEIEETSAGEYTEVENSAIEHGWNPEGVEGKANLSAEEFMGRQPLYDDIRSLKKSNRKLQDGIEAVKQMQEGIRVREREKTIAELKNQKRQALEEENYDAVINIDDQIAAEQVVEAPANNLAFENWVDGNEWYHQDQDMKAYADMIGAGYYQQNPKKDMGSVYEYVEKEVKQRFPDKFNNSKRDIPSPVEGAGNGRRGRSSASSYNEKDLPEQDRQIMRTIVRSGTMTKAEYLKEYFE